MAPVPKPIINFISLFCGPFYLVLVASILSRTSGILMVEALIAVGAGSLVLSGLLITICSRLVNQRSSRKYSISTLLMLMSVLAIYLAYLRQIFSKIDTTKFELPGYAACALFGFLFVYISTIVMVLFVDAALSLIQIFVNLLRINSRHR